MSMPLSPEMLVQAYASGAFPMADPEEGGAIYWHIPERRGIIPLDERFSPSKNLMRLYRKEPFELRINRDFEQVIRTCAELRADDTWISEEIIQAYCELNRLGLAHSFEAWDGDELVGGLYGVSLRRAFFGESMFHKRTDASKLCLVFLVEFLREQGFELLDSQYLNSHIAQFGAYEVEHSEFMFLLEQALSSVEA
jgi:leucyl/phenylalanyl-tRNA--protein transferase